MEPRTNMKPRTSIISFLVFVATLAVVFISIMSVLFPALIVVSVSPHQDSIPINPLEPGVWALHFLTVNITLLILGLLYFKKRLPNLIMRSIKTILDFEVSKKVTFVIMLVLISSYIGFTVPELSEPEIWGDFEGVKNQVDNWSFNDGKGLVQFRHFLLNISINVFDSYRMVPFLFSIALLILTYFFTVKISQKRFSGILAVMVILQSYLFLEYDTTATYENIWTVLYLVSLYTIYKKWYLSPFAFIFSVFSKSLTAIFLPMSLFFIYRSGIPKREVVKAFNPYGIIIALFIAVLNLGDLPLPIPQIYYERGLDDLSFWRGFTSFAYQLRYDGLVLTLVLPLVVGLYLVSRRGVRQADSIMIMIMGMLLAAPLLVSLTPSTIQPYRFVPLVVFFAIGVGTLFSKRLIERPQDPP